MKTVIIAALAVVIVAVVAGGIFIIMGDDTGSDKGAEESDKDDIIPDKEDGGPDVDVKEVPANWSYVGGDVGSFGVTDSLTPLTREDFVEVWKISDVVDTGSMAWDVPSSAISVGDRVYYYNGSHSALCCLEASTGRTLASAECESESVFNMAIAYGDGKIFVCTCTGETTIMKAFDANDLKQLFVSEPVYGGQVQGTITYKDGKVFFGTYTGDYACFPTADTDVSRPDEVISPKWVLNSAGWYNATPAFFDDYIVLVERGFDSGGATAFFMDSDTGEVIDRLSFDLEYASSGATAYEGRVYIPLNKVIDRTETNPNEMTPEHLCIHSMEITSKGFVRSSEVVWESDCEFGGTQSIPVIWNDTIYIGGGGKTLSTDEPFWIINIDEVCNMKTREKLEDVCTKGTAAITTGYANKENGYAVYIYLIEYGHVYAGEKADSTNGYADIFVIKDSKTEGTEVVLQFRPDPAQFAFQSFTITDKGYVLIRNDSTLFCYGKGSTYTASEVSDSIERFLEMAESGNVNYLDYTRIMYRYEELSSSEKAKVFNYDDLERICCELTLKRGESEEVIKVPKGVMMDLNEKTGSSGKIQIGWNHDGSGWESFRMVVDSDMTLEAVYSDSVVVTLDPKNGTEVLRMMIAEGSTLPFILDPVRSGYAFDGWKDGDGKVYEPTKTQISSDVTLYAQWLKLSTLRFDTDGGSSVAGTYQVVYNRPIEALPTVSKVGNHFDGWYYKDQRYDVGMVYPFEVAVTLKARWVENEDTTVTNGEGLWITAKIDGSATVTMDAAYSEGLESTEIRSKMPDAECAIIRLKGEGIMSDLSIHIDLETTARDTDSVDIYYYDASGLHKTIGKVTSGKLGFDLKGSNGGGGVEIVFGAGSQYGILNHLG